MMPNMFGGDQLSEDYAPWFHEDVVHEQSRVLGKPECAGKPKYTPRINHFNLIVGMLGNLSKST